MAEQPRTQAPRIPGITVDDPHLMEGYEWAVSRSLAWVQTGKPDALPSYWAGLTDRPMFYARDFVHQALAGHLLGLGAENATMFDAFIDSATPARRGYPLWSFFFDGAVPELDYHADDDFVREVPIVFELIDRGLELFRWTGDERYRSAPETMAYHRAAMTDFVELHDPLRNGVAGEFQSGDIFAGSATYNEGPRASGMRVAGDGIASQLSALRALAAESADSDFARWCVFENDRIGRLFEGEWWDSDRGHYATGFSEDGAVTDFGYEPSWFPAVKAVMDPTRARSHLSWIDHEVVRTPPPNIEAFTYLPEAFFQYGEDVAGVRWLRHLIDSRADYPEVPFIVVSTLLAGLPGIRPLPGGALETRTHLPESTLEVTSVPFRDHLLDVRHDGSGATTLTVHGGDAPVTWVAWNDNRRTETTVAPGEQVSVGTPLFP